MNEIQGLQIQTAGTYVLMEDVVSAIRAYAQSLEDPNAGALIHDLATWLDSSRGPEIEDEAPQDSVPHGAEEDDITLDVGRVEVYPILTSRGLKWYARSIDTGGFILKITDGSYDQTFVIRNAEERWPGIPIHLLENAGQDSKWTEDGTRGVFPSKGPPVRRLFAGAGR